MIEKQGGLQQVGFVLSKPKNIRGMRDISRVTLQGRATHLKSSRNDNYITMLVSKSYRGNNQR